MKIIKRNKYKMLIFACSALGFFPIVASAATVTVVHGINGLDLGSASSLPVDVAVNGSCAIKGFLYTQTTRVDLAGGSYSVTVHPADGSCSKTPVLTQSVTVPSSARCVGLVASLSDSGKPKLSAFVNDSPYRRALFVNNAAASSPFFAGAGPRDMIFYYGNPLRNSDGIMVLASDRPMRLSVRTIRVDRKRPFFQESFRLTRSRAFYVVGSNKSGLRVVSENLGS